MAIRRGVFHLAEHELPRRGEPRESAYLLLDRSCDGEYGPGCAPVGPRSISIARRVSTTRSRPASSTRPCANGHYDSCRLLGTMYLRGKGVERDRKRAKELLERFRLNAQRRHLRLGVQAGLPSVVGGELEAVLPIPGPALSIGGAFSYIPGGGAVLVLIEGQSDPDQAPDLRVLQASGRFYPNPQARGLYGARRRASALGQWRLDQGQARASWVECPLGHARSAGLRLPGDSSSVSVSSALLDLEDFDEDEEGIIPIVLPYLSVSLGLAAL